jgi:hypothetical protein
MIEWAGGNFDPSAFNAHDIDRAFHGGWGPKRPVQPGRSVTDQTGNMGNT